MRCASYSKLPIGTPPIEDVQHPKTWLVMRITSSFCWTLFDEQPTKGTQEEVEDILGVGFGGVDARSGRVSVKRSDMSGSSTKEFL